MVTSLNLLSCTLADPDEVQTVETDGLSNLEHFLCGENEVVFSGIAFAEFARISPFEDLRNHQSDSYFKIDTNDMQLITHYSTRQYERILYADAEKFVVLHGRELQTRSAATGKQQSIQETDLFWDGGNFTIETGYDLCL